MGRKTSGRFGQGIAAPKLRHCICCPRPDLIHLADRPSALQTARLKPPRQAGWRAGFSAAEEPLAPGLGKARDDAFGGVLLASLPEQRKGGLARRRNPLCSTDCAAGKSRIKAAASPPSEGFAIGNQWRGISNGLTDSSVKPHQ